MKATSFLVSFQRSLFREPLQLKSWLTTLLPPPSAVAGFFGALLGIPRENLYEWSKNKLFGAKLLSFNGWLTEYASIIKYKRPKKREIPSSRLKSFGIMDSKYSLLNIRMMSLFKPEYLFIVAGEIDKILEFIQEKKAVFFPYGGNSDCMLTGIKKIHEGEIKYSNIGEGVAKMKDVDNIRLEKGGIVRIVHYPQFKEDFCQVFRGEIILKRDYPTFDGVLLHEAGRFIIGKYQGRPQ